MVVCSNVTRCFHTISLTRALSLDQILHCGQICGLLPRCPELQGRLGVKEAARIGMLEIGRERACSCLVTILPLRDSGASALGFLRSDVRIVDFYFLAGCLFYLLAKQLLLRWQEVDGLDWAESPAGEVSSC